MLANTVVLTALLSSMAVAAIPSSFKRDDDAFTKCRNDCFNNIPDVAACTKDPNPDACACNVAPSNDVKSLKCVFDCLDQVGTRNPFPYSRLNAQAGVQNVPSLCGGSSSPPPKDSASVASKFSIPSCAANCVTADVVPDCKDSLTDPNCVCKALDNVSTPGPSAFSMTKCMLDKCGEQDAAVAVIQLGVDCGDWTANLDASKFQYPLNKLKKTFDAGSNSTTASATDSGAPASNTANNASAAPTDSAKKSDATQGFSSGSLWITFGMIALGFISL